MCSVTGSTTNSKFVSAGSNPPTSVMKKVTLSDLRPGDTVCAVGSGTLDTWMVISDEWDAYSPEKPFSVKCVSLTTGQTHRITGNKDQAVSLFNKENSLIEPAIINDNLLVRIMQERHWESSEYIKCNYDQERILVDDELNAFLNIAKHFSEHKKANARNAAYYLATMLFDLRTKNKEKMQQFLNDVHNRLPHLFFPMLSEYFAGNHDT